MHKDAKDASYAPALFYGLHTADRERQRRRKKRAAADLAV